MGIDISLQDESGEILEHISDPQNYLHELLPSYNDHSYQFLRFIDWYGVTIFNQMQMKVFIAEWKRLHNKVKTEKRKKVNFSDRKYGSYVSRRNWSTLEISG